MDAFDLLAASPGWTTYGDENAQPRIRTMSHGRNIEDMSELKDSHMLSPGDL